MTHNHEFINLSLLTFRQVVESENNIHKDSGWSNICSAFKIFTDTLIEHMNVEDSNCYFQVDITTNCDPLFYRLISDHINIRKLIKECQLLISANEWQKFSIMFSQLDQLIEEHSIREENLMELNTNNFEASTIQIIKLLRNMHINHSDL